MTPPKPFITASEAARILGVDTHRLPAFVAEGLLSIRSLPGVRTRYRRDEAEAIAARQWSKAEPTAPAS